MKKAIFFLIPLWLFITSCFGDEIKPPGAETAGELLGQPIPMGNYFFVAKVVLTFGTPWGGIPSTREQFEERVQNDLLLSFEAFRRNITVTPEEIEPEITKTLKENKVDFDWKTDKTAYSRWAQETLGEPVEVFENQMRHLIQLKRLQQQVLDSIQPDVAEEEAFQEFLNEYNTLSIELVQFDDLQEAENFYQQAKSDPQFWDKKKKESPGRFKRPGFVALEFLMHMWKLPKKTVYDMIDMKIGAVYPPTPIYRGHGVFKILEIRRADQTDFPRLRKSYYDQVQTQKRYEGFNKWLENLRKESHLRIDVKPPEDLFQDTKK